MIFRQKSVGNALRINHGFINISAYLALMEHFGIKVENLVLNALKEEYSMKNPSANALKINIGMVTNAYNAICLNTIIHNCRTVFIALSIWFTI